MSERKKPHPLKDFAARYANIHEKKRPGFTISDFALRNQFMILDERNPILVQPLEFISQNDSTGEERRVLVAKVAGDDNPRYYDPGLIRYRIVKRLLKHSDREFLARYLIPEGE